MSLHLVNIVKSRMGIQAMTSLHAHFDDHDDFRVMFIKCRQSPSPIFLNDGDTERFFIRTGLYHRPKRKSDPGIYQTAVYRLILRVSCLLCFICNG